MKKIILTLLVASAITLSACSGQATTTTSVTAESSTTAKVSETIMSGTVALKMDAKGGLVVTDENKKEYKATYDPKLNTINYTDENKKPVSIILPKGTAVVANNAEQKPTVYVDGQAHKLTETNGILTYKDNNGKDVKITTSVDLKLPTSIKATTTATSKKEGTTTTGTTKATQKSGATKATSPVGSTTTGQTPVSTTAKATYAPATTPKATATPQTTQPAVTTKATTAYVPPATEAPTTAAPTTEAPTTAAPTEPPATEPPATEPPATEPAPTEAYRVSSLGNSGMEWLYDSYGGEVGAMNAADDWARNYNADQLEAGNLTYTAWTITPLAWSDGTMRSCTVNFY